MSDTPERCQCRQAVSAGGAQTPGRATEADPVGDTWWGQPEAMPAAEPAARDLQIRQSDTTCGPRIQPRRQSGRGLDGGQGRQDSARQFRTEHEQRGECAGPGSCQVGSSRGSVITCERD